MNNKRLIFTCLISLILVCILFIGNTQSLLTVQEIDENLNSYSTGSLNITYEVSSDEVVLKNSYPLSYDEAMQLDPYRITIHNNGSVDYKFNLILNDTTETNTIDYKYINVQIGTNKYFKLNTIKDNILKDNIIVKANSSIDIDIFFWLDEKTPNSQIGKGFYSKINIDGYAVNSTDDNNNTNLIYSLDRSGANKPNIDNSMIPVYYDYEKDAWCKADINNRNQKYIWYDYSNKMWANAVIVKENGTKSRQQYTNEDKPGQIINNEDILAFFTWIPRFKYKIWNLNRQNNSKITNIDIKFENKTDSTGNIKCIYNLNNKENKQSDECSYINNNKSENTWYTHPAFTYNDNNLTGFWIGKFETTGSSSNPTILPDTISLRNQNIKEQLATSLIFNNYGLNNQKTRIIRNTEWGAVSILTNSIYGICNTNKDSIECPNLYNNNSQQYYTGSSNNNDNTTAYGTYNYQGYQIDTTNNQRIINKNNKTNIIASTTHNIYGVYDMTGGATERVMAGVKNIEGIDNKYFEIYSNYGDGVYNTNSKLGDGTIEYSKNNNKFNNNNYIFIRGNSNKEKSNIFYYNFADELANNEYTFRVVIS